MTVVSSTDRDFTTWDGWTGVEWRRFAAYEIHRSGQRTQRSDAMERAADLADARRYKWCSPDLMIRKSVVIDGIMMHAWVPPWLEVRS